MFCNKFIGCFQVNVERIVHAVDTYVYELFFTM